MNKNPPKARQHFDDYATAAAMPGSAYAEPERSKWHCSADGCMCSVIYAEAKACRFHWRLDSQLWPAMTQRLREVEWMLKLLAWVRGIGNGDTRYRDGHERILKTLQHRDAMDIAPKTGENLALWVHRADKWIEAPIMKMKKLVQEEMPL